MKTKIMRIGLLCLCLVYIGSVNIEPALAQKEKHIIIAGSHAAGTWYRYCGAIGAMVDKYIPGWKATAQPSPGSVENVRNLIDKSIDMAMLLPSAAYQAYKGLPPFEPYPNLRGLFNTYSFPDNIIVKENSPFKSVADFKGMRIAVGPPGSGSQLVHKIILAEYGLTFEDCKTRYLTNNESANALVDGNVDAAFIELPFKSSVVSELMTMHKVRYIPMSMEKLESINKKYPYLVPGIIPKGTYERVKEDIPAVFQWGLMCCDANMDKEIVYNITRVVFEHKPEIVKILSLAEEMTPEKASKYLPIPLHPGAEKYYREIGVLK
jgi:TRAP transporter TAXI family solute receptor